MKIAVVFLILGLSGFATAQEAAAPDALSKDVVKGACMQLFVRLMAAVSQYTSSKKCNKTSAEKRAEFKSIYSMVIDIVNLMSVEANQYPDGFIMATIVDDHHFLTSFNILETNSEDFFLQMMKSGSELDTLCIAQDIYKMLKKHFPDTDGCVIQLMKRLRLSLDIDINIVRLAMGCESPSLAEAVQGLVADGAGTVGVAGGNGVGDHLFG